MTGRCLEQRYLPVLLLTAKAKAWLSSASKLLPSGSGSRSKVPLCPPQHSLAAPQDLQAVLGPRVLLSLEGFSSFCPSPPVMVPQTLFYSSLFPFSLVLTAQGRKASGSYSGRGGLQPGSLASLMSAQSHWAETGQGPPVVASAGCDILLWDAQPELSGCGGPPCWVMGLWGRACQGVCASTCREVQVRGCLRAAAGADQADPSPLSLNKGWRAALLAVPPFTGTGVVRGTCASVRNIKGRTRQCCVGLGL